MSGSYTLTVAGLDTGSDHPCGSPLLNGASLSVSEAVVFAEGTGAEQSKKIYSNNQELLAAVPVELDLQTALGPYGDALALAGVPLIYLKAPVTNTVPVTISAAAVNGWTEFPAAGITLDPGCWMIKAISAGGGTQQAVGGSDKVLSFLSSANGDIQIRILGR